MVPIVETYRLKSSTVIEIRLFKRLRNEQCRQRPEGGSGDADGTLREGRTG